MVRLYHTYVTVFMRFLLNFRVKIQGADCICIIAVKIVSKETNPTCWKVQLS